MATKPTLGRIVLYRSKVGDGIDSPAMVIRTRDTTNLDVIERWGPGPEGTLSGKGRPEALVPELPSDFHVDLHVFGLGGTYQEYCVPFDETRDANVPPFTWRWPPRD